MYKILLRTSGLLFFLMLTCFVYGQDTAFDYGNISFSLSTKVMDEGTKNDISLGYIYTDKFLGNALFRYNITSQNDEFQESFVESSLIARDERIYQLYLLPFSYHWKRNTGTRFTSGIGLYYEHSSLHEKGFFDVPSWDDERVNSFINNFSSHIAGPLIDIRFQYSYEWLNISLNGGIVPVFFLSTDQERSIIPLTENVANYSQQSAGSPYLYFGLSAVFLKYVNVGLEYNYSLFEYQLLDLDDNGNWIHPEQKIINNSFAIEASALIPVGGDMRFQIGYGFVFDTLTTEAGDFKDNKQYLVLSTRKYF